MARGADFESGNIINRRKFGSFARPAFVSSFRRADELAIAMGVCCYAAAWEDPPA